MRRVRAVVADDHPAMLLGLRLTLPEHGVDVVGAARDGEEAEHLILTQSPEVAIIDIRMPRQSGLDLCAKIRLLRPEIAFIVLSTYDDAMNVTRAYDLGVRAFLTKDTPVAEIARVAQMVVANPNLNLIRVPRVPELTRREQDVLGGLASGMSNRELADALGIGMETVKDHCSSLFAKLNVVDRGKAVAEARRLGLIGDRPPE